MNDKSNIIESGGNQEFLIVLKNSEGNAKFLSIGSIYKIRQVVSSRVFTVECSGAELTALRKMPDLTVVSGGNSLPESVDNLTEGEKLFVAAWMSRQQKQETKQRPGDGLSWDAPGFTPPDPPAA